MSKTKPNHLAFTARFRVEDLATCAAFLESRGIQELTRAGVARMILEQTASLIAKNHPEFTFHNIHDAYTFLKSRGLIKGAGERTTRSLLSDMVGEDKIKSTKRTLADITAELRESPEAVEQETSTNNDSDSLLAKQLAAITKMEEE